MNEDIPDDDEFAAFVLAAIAMVSKDIDPEFVKIVDKEFLELLA